MKAHELLARKFEKELSQKVNTQSDKQEIEITHRIDYQHMTLEEIQEARRKHNPLDIEHKDYQIVDTQHNSQSDDDAEQED
jgi:hypothetical protein